MRIMNDAAVVLICGIVWNRLFLMIITPLPTPVPMHMPIPYPLPIRMPCTRVGTRGLAGARGWVILRVRVLLATWHDGVLDHMSHLHNGLDVVVGLRRKIAKLPVKASHRLHECRHARGSGKQELPEALALVATNHGTRQIQAQGVLAERGA